MKTQKEKLIESIDLITKNKFNALKEYNWVLEDPLIPIPNHHINSKE